MNCLRNSWLDAMSVKALNSSTVSSKVSFFMASNISIPTFRALRQSDGFELLFEQLFAIEAGVISTRHHQLYVRTLLDDTAVFERHDAVRLAHGGDTVRDQDDGAA